MKGAQAPWVNKSEGETTPVDAARLNWTENRLTELVSLLNEVGEEALKSPAPVSGSTKLITPVMSGGSVGLWTDLWKPTVRTAVLTRCVVPTTGSLADISFLTNEIEGGGGSCKGRVAIYKVSDDKEETYTLLAQSGTLFLSSNGWESVSFAGPSLKAGDTVFLGLMVDAVTPIRFWCQNVEAWGDTTLPEGYLGESATTEANLLVGWKFPTFEFKTFKHSELVEATEPDFGGGPAPSLAIIARIA